ncbi:hypothetical protein [Floridanema aerugineum]|uniref:Uncharacterized protein n=1 Tax=Floridaenema aerugineum BLCC-F46 TaxID=3153654 RepID=A0ABV4X4Q9_9CYAN
MIDESLFPQSKVYLVKGGDAKVFGEDSDIRRRMTDTQAIERFKNIWEKVLEPEIRKAPIITAEEAKELLEGKQRDYAIRGFQFRQFSLHSAVFVARLNKDATEDGVCDQLWGIGAHRDNTRLCMYFETVEEKLRFEEIASNLKIEPRQLALQLVMDFVHKFPADWH